MSGELLDHELIVPKGKKAGFLNWTSILALWAGIGFCLAYGIIMNSSVVVAGVLLTATTIYSYLHFKNGVKTTMIVILLGVFEWIEFFPFGYSVYFQFGGPRISVQFLLIGVAMVHYLTNRKYFAMPKNEIPEKEDNDESRESIDSFKRRYAGRSAHELEKIIQDTRYVPAAIKAAKELVEERRKAGES